MYQQLQDLLTFAIEAVAIIGYGGIFAHYILTSSFAKQPALVSSKTVPINTTSEHTKEDAVKTTDATNASSINTATEALDTSNINVDCTTLSLPESEQIEKLTLRQCRAVIRSLNSTVPKSASIRLKINGKDAPISWLQAQIRKHLEDRRLQAAPIIEQILKAS